MKITIFLLSAILIFSEGCIPPNREDKKNSPVDTPQPTPKPDPNKMIFSQQELLNLNERVKSKFDSNRIEKDKTNVYYLIFTSRILEASISEIKWSDRIPDSHFLIIHQSFFNADTFNMNVLSPQEAKQLAEKLSK